MLEIRNVTKIYKSKSGDVTALDSVSLSFDDTGLVFILGKSGSGKSTLLNVIGGLDKADSGEILVKGKSDGDFSQADYDSYRNTYVGFIFQEYNLLSELSVRDNIALAVELQGKKLTKEQLDSLLSEVDLVGYGDRKPSELSGGQKQRVAIARALVKAPEIIMADEPTGALDSKSGAMVFDTLKKLSATKLVVVVSHDRDFAESFGDRVIEIADGKVISDISKKKSPIESDSGVLMLGDGLIKIASGHKLTESDIERINTLAAEKEVFISADDKENNEIKKRNGIEGDHREYFVPTEPSTKESKEECRFIRSRLPFANALRMSLGNLKVKPFRLVMTILLSAIAFALLGLMGTLASFDSEQTTYDSIVDTGIDYLALTKEIDSDEYSFHTNMSDDDVEYLSERFPNINFLAAYATNTSYESNINKTNAVFYSNRASFYNATFVGMTEISEKFITDSGFSLYGKLPSKDDEIAVTEYCYEQFKLGGYVSDGTAVQINSHNDLIGKKLTLWLFESEEEYTITGVIDTHLDATPYADFLPGSTADQENATFYRKYAELNNLLTNSYHTLAFVNDGYVEKLNKVNAGYEMESPIGRAFILFNEMELYTKTFKDFSGVGGEIIYLPGKTAANRGDILVSADFLYNITFTKAGVDYGVYELFDKYRNKLSAEYPTLSEEAMGAEIIKALVADYGSQISTTVKAVNMNFDGTVVSDLTLNVVGIVLQKDVFSGESAYYMDKEDLATLAVKKMAPYSAVMAKMPDDGLMEMIRFTTDDGIDGTSYRMENSVTTTMSMVNDTFDILADIFLYCGIGCALFAALMLMNFISVSINAKRREIGILRAVGARGTDVLAVFFGESAIIALINFAIASVITACACLGINNMLRSSFGLPVTLLHFGVLELAIIFGISILTAFVGSALPVFRLSKKRPVDTMRI